MRILRKECASLAKAFGDVTLVVGDGQGDAVDPASGVKIVDIGRPPGRGRLGRMVGQPWRLVRKVRALAPDVVHIHDAELLPALLVLRASGIAGIYDIHEDLPKQILDKAWIPAVIRRPMSFAARLFERWVTPLLTALVPATPAIAERFEAFHRRVVTVNNYPIADELLSDSGGGERNVLCFVGGITRIRGIRQLFDALSLVPDVKLVLCGAFESAAFESELRQHAAWSQVDYRGVVDRPGVGAVLKQSFAGLVTYLPAANHMEAQPTKVFEYMSAGVPVIGSDFPLWRRIIADTDAGLVVDPEDPAQIAGAIRALRDDPGRVTQMGARGRALVMGELNWNHEAEKLVALYKTVAGARAAL